MKCMSFVAQLASGLRKLFVTGLRKPSVEGGLWLFLEFFFEQFSSSCIRFSNLENVSSNKEITASDPFLYASKIIFRSTIISLPCMVYLVFTQKVHIRLVN